MSSPNFFGISISLVSVVAGVMSFGTFHIVCVVYSLGMHWIKALNPHFVTPRCNQQQKEVDSEAKLSGQHVVEIQLLERLYPSFCGYFFEICPSFMRQPRARRRETRRAIIKWSFPPSSKVRCALFSWCAARWVCACDIKK